MKLRKIFASAIATTLAVTALAAAASAGIYVTPGDYYVPAGQPGPILGTAGNWLIQIYNIGNEAESKPAVDFDIDVTKIAKIDIVMEPAGDFKDLFEGAWGGSVIFSANGGEIGKATSEAGSTEKANFDKYNWPQNEWWGIINNGEPIATGAEAVEGVSGIQDPTLGLYNSLSLDKELQTVALQDGTYLLSYEIPEEDRWIAGGECYQTGLQQWGSDLAETKVDMLILYDADGNVMLAFDELGNPIEASEATYAEPIDLAAALAAANGGAAEETTVAADATTAAGDETTVAADATTAADANADVAETTIAETTTPASGLSTTTIIIIVVAAVVIIAVIVIIVVVSKKKK